MAESDLGQTRESDRVFLSHAHGDRDAVKDIARALRTAKFTVWFDEWELQFGDSISARIRERLSASDFLVVLLSPESVKSRWVREEMDLALSGELRQRAITVVPAVLRDCEIPRGLDRLMSVDLRGDHARGVSKLVETLSLARTVNFSRLSPRRFEELVADLFRAEGFSVHMTMATRDGGHDLLLTMPVGSTGPVLFAVQIKHYKEHRVSVETIRSAVGSAVLAGKHARGLIVSSSQLTSAAQELVSDVNSKGLLKLEVIDGPDLELRVLQHPDVVNKYFRQGDGA